VGDDQALIQVAERVLADAEEAFRLEPTPENQRRIQRAWSAVRDARQSDAPLTPLASGVLDVLDPPRWEPPPPGATRLVRRCHELRSVPIQRLSVEDLRLLIGQAIALPVLVPFALKVLRSDPLVAGDFYAGDLLATVLRIDSRFWEEHRELDQLKHSIVRSIEPDRLDDVPADLREELRKAGP
jgi:hypothetical protein